MFTDCPICYGTGQSFNGGSGSYTAKCPVCFGAGSLDTDNVCKCGRSANWRSPDNIPYCGRLTCAPKPKTLTERDLAL